MYRLNVQVTVYGQQIVPNRGLGAWSGHVTHYKFIKFCTHVGYINFSNRLTYHQQKGVWLWSRDCFEIFAVCRDAAHCTRLVSDS